jgi:class 3 adenylate cyclase
MIPTSEPLQKLLLHIAGHEQLKPKEGRRRLTEAVELNKQAQEIISTYGNKEFRAAVGFVDMRGFSILAQGKSPTEVLAFAKPFVDVVIDIAKKRQWFVDKTIGDEVMVICPLFEEDVRLADVGLAYRDDLLIEAVNFVSDILVAFKDRCIQNRLSAGFALGSLVLGRVGTPDYSEWTCYGNVVNTGKRLQSIPRPESFDDVHWLVMGSSKHECPNIESTLDIWLRIWPATGCLQLLSPQKKIESLKGVGETVFVATGVDLKDGY